MIVTRTLPGKLCRTNAALIRYARSWTRGIHDDSARPNSRVSIPNLKYNDDLFNFTRGRFVCDQAYEMSQRHIRFDVNELARCAIEAVGATSCINIEKYPDGMYNKAMLLTMDNGHQVVAKIPNPNAGAPHFTTACEVATMDFARSVLGTPVPKVLAWSSRANANPVGAEYIIMEKVAGTQLEQVWPSMKITDKFNVVKAIAGFQKKWASISFHKFGSLYYTNDLDTQSDDAFLYTDVEGTKVKNSTFSVGPSTGRELFDNGRALIDFDRGPWSTLEEYHVAIGNREIASVRDVPRLPKSPITLCGPGTYQPTRENKLNALTCYLELIKFLLPSDESISTSNLWHRDLHVANVFVNPDNPVEITGIIDWQSIELSPLYFQARQPHIIDYDGPPVHGLEKPRPPENMQIMEPEAKERANNLYYQQSLCVLYNTLINKLSPRIYASLEFQQTKSFSLLLLARNILIDGEATYLAQVAELEAIWNTLPGAAQNSPFPFSFSDKERKTMEANVEGALRGIELMRSIKECIGDLFPEQGLVMSEQYDEALNALDQMKEQVIEEFATNQNEREEWEREWPFGT